MSAAHPSRVMSACMAIAANSSRSFIAIVEVSAMPLLPLTESGQRPAHGWDPCRATDSPWFVGVLVPYLVGNELPDRRVPQHALDLEVLHPDPQLRPKPLSRALPQPSQRRLGARGGRHSFPPGRSERQGRVQNSRAGKLKPTTPI